MEWGLKKHHLWQAFHYLPNKTNTNTMLIAFTMPSIHMHTKLYILFVVEHQHINHEKGVPHKEFRSFFSFVRSLFPSVMWCLGFNINLMYIHDLILLTFHLMAWISSHTRQRLGLSTQVFIEYSIERKKSLFWKMDYDQRIECVKFYEI